MAFELQQLRQVIALAEHGSFVRAAAALHISQPALSRSIQNLERSFGSQLFHRSTAGVVPTDRGRLYIERARDLLRMADDLDREAISDRALQVGRVAVGAGPFPAESFLGPASSQFVERYPRVALRVRPDDPDSLAAGLRSRELDFFIAETSTLQREPDLAVEPLSSKHALHFVARTGHPLAAQGAPTVEDVLSYPFATPARIPPRILDPLLSAHRATLRRGAAPRPFPAIECSGLSPVKRILATSDAVSASILACVSRELEAREFALLGTQPWMHLDYGIVSLKGRPWTQHAREFLEYVREAQRAAMADEAQLVRRYGGRRYRR